MNDTTEKPICYPYLTGILTGKLEFLPHNLAMKGLITPEQREAIQEFCDKAIADAKAQEREFVG